MPESVGGASRDAAPKAAEDIKQTNEASKLVDIEETKAKFDKKGRDAAKNLI